MVLLSIITTTKTLLFVFTSAITKISVGARKLHKSAIYSFSGTKSLTRSGASLSCNIVVDGEEHKKSDKKERMRPNNKMMRREIFFIAAVLSVGKTYAYSRQLWLMVVRTEDFQSMLHPSFLVLVFLLLPSHPKIMWREVHTMAYSNTTKSYGGGVCYVGFVWVKVMAREFTRVYSSSRLLLRFSPFEDNYNKVRRRLTIFK